MAPAWMEFSHAHEDVCCASTELHSDSITDHLFIFLPSLLAGGRAGMVTVQGEGEGNAEQRLLTATRPSVPARQLWSIRSK